MVESNGASPAALVRLCAHGYERPQINKRLWEE
jgi:hypothetical protein